MFEKASRMKLRFPHRGMITTEDLWDLDVHQLDNMYKLLRAEQKEQEGESLLKTDKEDPEDVILGLQIGIVRHVVEVKLTEAEAYRAAADKKAQKERILEIIAQKQDEALAEKSVDELMELVGNL